MNIPSGRRDQQGAAALTTMLAAVVVSAALIGSLLLVGSIMATADRARLVADAASLAVVSGSPLAGGDGGPDVAAGRAVARANGGSLRSVSLDEWPLEVIVTVSVRLPAPLLGEMSAESRSRVRGPAVTGDGANVAGPVRPSDPDGR